MKKYILSGVVLAGLSVAIWGCIKEPDFSTTPYITFQSIRKIVATDAFSQGKKDSLIVTVFFQDGDGDLGMTQTEFQDAKSPLKGINNYEIKAFRSKNGVFSEIVLSPPLGGFFPPLRTDGKTGAIEGNLDYSFDFLQSFTPKRDTLRFEIRIRDRKLNYSNWVKTDPVVLNE
ncbi:MAG: hypothetical protein U0Y10_05180 [Spirosomataceae bacterium]